MEHDILAKHVPCSMMQQSLGKYYVDIATTHKRNSVTHAFWIIERTKLITILLQQLQVDTMYILSVGFLAHAKQIKGGDW